MEILDKKTGKVLRIAKPDEILRDGEVGRVSMTFMDAAPPPDLMIGLAALGREPVIMSHDQTKAADESRERYITRLGSRWKDASPLPPASSAPLQTGDDDFYARYQNRLENKWKVTA